MPIRKGLWAASFIAMGFVAAAPASAAVYQDAEGDRMSPGDAGLNHLDIDSVEVTNTASDLLFRVNLVGNPMSPDWGKYMIGIDSVDGAGTSTGNGWNRPISMNGMDYWVGSWMDSGRGAEVYQFASDAWARTATTYGQAAPLAVPTVSGNSFTLTIPLALLGLEPGESFDFDVYSSGGGGGDSAIDASSNPNIAASDWGVAYASGDNVSTYQVVPEPASLGVAGLAAVGLLVRRRR